MNSLESIEEFYRRKLNWVPDSVRKEVGHFNVFKLAPFVGTNAKPVPYSRRDYYKISLIKGNNKVHYADKVVEIKQRALLFANPQVPYNWEEIDKIQSGYFCVFTGSFFNRFGNLTDYELFQPNGSSIFELSENQADEISQVYERMFDEINSEYMHKYDILRTLVFELIHKALKINPSLHKVKKSLNASHRITTLFLELLERQFPIEDTRQRLNLRTPAAFADQLAIHVNHLNRALKKTTQKSTSDIIQERILQEAKILLKHSSWNISEIAYALGFNEVTHFNKFFKQHQTLAPTSFRNV
ncbi:helix-turn-helix domain-containing protein [Fulvivirga sp. M361]|uniref:helix-turn-helix domain-containing protein n=1 Tax=Fulvivirga sp. M361 TaxID=2594266 RepID=UPI00117A6C01|nr:helix-turn-helix transcriptional regulator [Fulvivirga sp. M361]TRX54345.1 helix-turn-helix domain-containing protein [Fulvivirga sp. M361]